MAEVKPIFTGPDGVRDCRRNIDKHNLYVGEGAMSMEGTSQVDYLWRAPTETPFPHARSHKVGEVGWGVPTHQDWEMPSSGKQIQLGEFRQMVEDRYTHLFQNPWYPGPKEEFPPDSDAALVMNVYKPSTSRSNRSDRNEQSSDKRPARSSHSDHSVQNNSNNNNNNNQNNNHYRYNSASSFETY